MRVARRVLSALHARPHATRLFLEQMEEALRYLVERKRAEFMYKQSQANRNKQAFKGKSALKGYRVVTPYKGATSEGGSLKDLQYGNLLQFLFLADPLLAVELLSQIGRKMDPSSLQNSHLVPVALGPLGLDGLLEGQGEEEEETGKEEKKEDWEKERGGDKSITTSASAQSFSIDKSRRVLR